MFITVESGLSVLSLIACKSSLEVGCSPLEV